MGTLFKKFANYKEPNSIALSLRKRRHAFLIGLLESIPRPLKILDIGGTAAFWDTLGLPSGDVHITLVNVHREAVNDTRYESVAGDARELKGFGDNSFDVVFSNSVIEHVGDLEDQSRMAREVRRVGRHYFIQTPNAYFPIEPHFLVPGFQFMPLALRTFLLTRFRLGHHAREPNLVRAREVVAAVRLLTPVEFRGLFPDAHYYEERFLGLTKSIVAYGGW